MPRGTSSLVSDLVAHLRSRLLAGDLAGDERVTESGIAAEYGVARSTARSALEILVTEGLLVSRPYSAMRVPIIDRREFPEILGLLEHVEARALEDLLTGSPDLRGLRDAADLSLHRFFATLVEIACSDRLVRLHRRCTFELILGVRQEGASDTAHVAMCRQERSGLASALFNGDGASARRALGTLHAVRRDIAGIRAGEMSPT